MLESNHNYNTTKREGLAMFYALNKFRHYLLGKHFKIFIDHPSLKYLVNKPMLGGGGGASIDGYYYFKNLNLK
jgi:hypothetical protein